MGEAAIVRISTNMFLIWILILITIPYVLDAQYSEHVDLLDQNTMESINNTTIRESVTLVLRIDTFDTDMDGILDTDEPPEFRNDFDNDVGQPDNLSNPVRPNTGPDGFDHDSDNDGIEDWPHGNDTILFNTITGASKYIGYMSEWFLIYLDEINEGSLLENISSNQTFLLDISEIDEGEHVIHVQHYVNDGFNINTTTYEFYIEIRKDITDYNLLPIIWMSVFYIILIFIMLFIVMRFRKRELI